MAPNVHHIVVWIILNIHKMELLIKKCNKIMMKCPDGMMRPGMMCDEMSIDYTPILQFYINFWTTAYAAFCEFFFPIRDLWM